MAIDEWEEKHKFKLRLIEEDVDELGRDLEDLETCGSLNDVYSKCVRISGLEGYSVVSGSAMNDNDSGVEYQFCGCDNKILCS